MWLSRCVTRMPAERAFSSWAQLMLDVRQADLPHNGFFQQGQVPICIQQARHERPMADRLPPEARPFAVQRQMDAKICIRMRLGKARHFRKPRSEEHTSELQSLAYLVCRLLLEKKKRY